MKQILQFRRGPSHFGTWNRRSPRYRKSHRYCDSWIMKGGYGSMCGTAFRNWFDTDGSRLHEELQMELILSTRASADSYEYTHVRPYGLNSPIPSFDGNQCRGLAYSISNKMFQFKKKYGSCHVSCNVGVLKYVTTI